MGQEITLSKEQYSELDEFRPELFRRDMAQIRSISDVAIRELRKEQKALAANIEEIELDPETVETMRVELRDRCQEVLSRVAHLRAVHVSKAVAYWDKNIIKDGPPYRHLGRGPINDPSDRTVVPGPQGGMKTAAELSEELGFANTTVSTWRVALHKVNEDSDDPDKMHPEQYAEQLLKAWLRSAGVIEKPERTGPHQPVEDPEDKDEAWAHEMLAEYIDGTPRGQHMFLDLLAKHRKVSDPFKRY